MNINYYFVKLITVQTDFLINLLIFDFLFFQFRKYFLNVSFCLGNPSGQVGIFSYNCAHIKNIFKTKQVIVWLCFCFALLISLRRFFWVLLVLSKRLIKRRLHHFFKSLFAILTIIFARLLFERFKIVFEVLQICVEFLFFILDYFLLF